MYKIAIVDDDVEITEKLASYCEQFARETGVTFEIQQFNSSEVFLEFYREKTDYDLLLLDIEMGDMSGMEAAQIIREIDDEIVIVFVTNMIQYAVQGYAVDALDFVVKPVQYGDFSFRLKRILGVIERKREHLVTIQTVEGLISLPTKELYYIEVQGHKLSFYTSRKVYYSTGTLVAIENMLPSYQFVKPHQSFLVNLAHVESITSAAVLIGNDEIPISRPRKSEFLRAFGNFVGGLR